MEDQSKALTVFNFEEQEIRTVVIDDKIWFVAADVCKALDIKNVNHAVNGNPSRNEEGLDEDERGYYNVTTPGGLQQMLCINESGIQELIWKSRKPKAKAFKRWVKRDVIPSIARTGVYDPQGQIVAMQQEILQLREGSANYLKMLTETVTMPGLSEEGLKHIESFGVEKALLQLRKIIGLLEAKEGEILTQKDLQRLRSVVVDVCSRSVDVDTELVMVSKRFLQQDQIIAQLQLDLKQLQLPGSAFALLPEQREK